MKKLLAILPILGLTACVEDNAKQCQSLINDSIKRDSAYSVCEKAANEGDVKAQLSFAQILKEKEQFNQALSYLEKAANQGDAQALYQLGEAYLQGKGTNKDLAKAKYYWEQSCNKGEQKACADIRSQEQAEKAEQERLQKEKEEQTRLEKERLEQERLEKEREEKERLAQEAKEKAEAEEKLKAEKEATLKAEYEAKAQLAEQARLEAERKAFELEQKAAQLRLEEQRRALQNQAQATTTTSTQTTTYSSAQSGTLLNFDASQFTFYEGLAKFEEYGKFGYVDASGNIIIPAQFSRAGRFSEGIANVQGSNGLWGYINRTGKFIVDPQFVCSGKFQQGLAGIYIGGYQTADGKCLDGKWGFIDKSGNLAIQAIYDDAQGFSKDSKGRVKTKVTYQGNSFFIDKNGNQL